MASEFKHRVGLPLLMLVALVAGVGLILFSLSRVMLAISEMAAVFVALLVAAFVLLIAGTLGQRREVPGRALGVALTLGLVGVAAAGISAFQAGPRDIEPHGVEAEEPDDPDAEGEAEEAEGEIPEGAAVWVAVDIDYPDAPDAVGVGEDIALDNQGGIFHDVVIEETDEEILAAEGGEIDVATMELDPGTYVYYCSVPGHREAGMEGEVEVTE